MKEHYPTNSTYPPAEVGPGVGSLVGRGVLCVGLGLGRGVGRLKVEIIACVSEYAQKYSTSPQTQTLTLWWVLERAPEAHLASLKAWKKYSEKKKASVSQLARSWAFVFSDSTILELETLSKLAHPFVV